MATILLAERQAYTTFKRRDKTSQTDCNPVLEREPQCHFWPTETSQSPPLQLIWDGKLLYLILISPF